MIRKVVISNFKKFGQRQFDIPAHLVIAGPNNSGKTTLLQAIAAWSEIAFQWLENNPDLAREDDGNYPSTNLNLLRFHSVPLADFAHLWKNKRVKQAVSIWVYTEQWGIGFEIVFKEMELAVIRPARDAKEGDLEQYINDPLVPIYIPPLLGVDTKEAPFEPTVIPARLAQAQAGSVLRNLLLAVSRDSGKWQKLQEIIRSFFGYELLSPSGGSEILARYRHSPQDTHYDLSSAASGFLQVLMVYASLLHKEASVVLLDEPDAHLHILLQDKIYRDLRDYARQSGSQLIIATHSERLINVADTESLRLLARELRKVGDKKNLIRTLSLENTEIMLAETEPGILYAEGRTDIDILKEWTTILNHRLLSFLEKPFWRPTAEEEKRFPIRHFSALRLVISNFRGMELRDGDKKKDSETRSPPKGMERLYWERYEIESYLIHPQSIARFVKSIGGPDAEDKAVAYMKQQLPPVVYDSPLENSYEAKAKVILSRIMQEAGLVVKETDYYQIAAQMTQEEIHPEVVEKLDATAKHFSIQPTQDVS